jgi:hypothetical protein
VPPLTLKVSFRCTDVRSAAPLRLRHDAERSGYRVGLNARADQPSRLDWPQRVLAFPARCVRCGT